MIQDYDSFTVSQLVNVYPCGWYSFIGNWEMAPVPITWNIRQYYQNGLQPPPQYLNDGILRQGGNFTYSDYAYIYLIDPYDHRLYYYNPNENYWFSKRSWEKSWIFLMKGVQK
jgi:hypothetical protein